MAPRSFLGVGSPAATLIPHLALSAVLVAGAVIALRLPTSPVRPSVPPADPVPALTAAGADDSVARVLDTAIPRGEREAVIDDLALSSGPGSARDLMAIGDAGSDLGPRAIRRLGLRPRPEVRAYLERRVRDHGAPRAAELAAAAESLAEVAGPAAVPALADLLRAARRRTDGQGGGIAAACLSALTAVGGDTAARTLAADLAGLAGDPEAAAAVVTAIAGIGRPEALTALEAHAQALAAAVPEAGAGAGADPDRLRTRHLGLIIETMRVAEDIRRRNGLTP